VRHGWVKYLGSDARDSARVSDANSVEEAIREVYGVRVAVSAGDDRDDVKRAIRRRLRAGRE
jgi:hypothetical protein